MYTERRRARIGSASLSYEVAGAGAPVILMHGLSGSTRWWARNVEALAQRFRVYTVDLIGFGASRNGHPFVLVEAADYMSRWIDHMGLAQVHVIGHSMGGLIAADLAADHPDQVARLVLVAAAALPFNYDYTRHLLGALQALIQLPPSFWPVFVSDVARAGPLTIASALSELLTVDMRAKLAMVRAPTLLVWGERDAIIPVELGKWLGRYVRAEELVVIKGAGHAPMWECPQVFNREVTAFLAAAFGGAADADAQATRVVRPVAQG